MSDEENNSSGSESEDEVPSLVPWSEWPDIELNEAAVFGRDQLIKPTDEVDTDADVRYVKLESSNGGGRSTYQTLIIGSGTVSVNYATVRQRTLQPWKAYVQDSGMDMPSAFDSLKPTSSRMAR